MRPGTMGGQSRVASRASQALLLAPLSQATGISLAIGCPTLITAGFNLGHGTVEELTPDAPYPYPYNTSGAWQGYASVGFGLSLGGSVLTIWDDITYGLTNPHAGNPASDYRGYTRVSFPAMEFIDHYQLGSSGEDFYPLNLTTDNDGAVYYWSREYGPSNANRLIKQVGASWSVLATQASTVSPTSIANHDGPIWNPYDGMLYDVDYEGLKLCRYHPVTGAREDILNVSSNPFDYPACSPDGSLWFPLWPTNNPDSGFYRYDIATDTLDSRDGTQIPPALFDGIPVTRRDGSVVYRSPTTDNVIIMQPDFTWVEGDCAPFNGGAPFYGNGTARVAYAPNWSHSLFFFPTSSGEGLFLWDQT